MARTEVTGRQIKDKSVSLSDDVVDTLPVSNGGTGKATIAAGSVLVGNGTDAVTTVAPGTSGYVLTSNGSTWVSAAASGEVTLNGSQTLYNKTISGASNTLTNIPVSALSATGSAGSTTYLRGDGTWAAISAVDGTFDDNSFTLRDDADATKQVRFQLSSVSTGTTRTLTVPDSSSTIEVVANKGVANGYASLDGAGRVPTGQIPPGLLVDNVAVVNDSFQFYSGQTAIGSPVSFLVSELDGGSPSTTDITFIDGGTL